MSFRPLSGNYISQLFLQFHQLWKLSDRVSVPCRGTIFLNLRKEYKRLVKEKFPSPVGELYFSIIKYSASSAIVPESCFRPLSGNYISQNVFHLVKTNHNVSVPCRGTIFLNGGFDHEKEDFDKFPSPVGELYFSSGCWVSCVPTRGFRPLSGNYISQWP